jgi:hypothetical protein
MQLTHLVVSEFDNRCHVDAVTMRQNIYVNRCLCKQVVTCADTFRAAVEMIRGDIFFFLFA